MEKNNSRKCKFFNGINGSCNYGINCKFSHDINMTHKSIYKDIHNAMFNNYHNDIVYQDNYYVYDDNHYCFKYKYENDNCQIYQSIKKPLEISLNNYIDINDKGDYYYDCPFKNEWNKLKDIREITYKKVKDDIEARQIYLDMNFPEGFIIKRNFAIKKENLIKMQDRIKYLLSIYSFKQSIDDDFTDIRSFCKAATLLTRFDQHINNLNLLRCEAIKHGLEFKSEDTDQQIMTKIYNKIIDFRQQVNIDRNRQFAIRIGLNDNEKFDYKELYDQIELFVNNNIRIGNNRCYYLNRAKKLNIENPENMITSELMKFVEQSENDIRKLNDELLKQQQKENFINEHKKCGFFSYMKENIKSYTYSELISMHDECKQCKEERREEGKCRCNHKTGYECGICHIARMSMYYEYYV